MTAADLYETHRRALEDPTSVPAWGNATTEERRAWEAVAQRVELQRPACPCPDWCTVCATARGASVQPIQLDRDLHLTGVSSTDEVEIYVDGHRIPVTLRPAR